MNFAEALGKVLKVALVTPPHEMLREIGEDVSLLDPIYKDEIKKRYSFLRADPRNVNLTDECLMDMAVAEVDQDRDKYGAIFLIFSALVSVLCYSIGRISYYTALAHNQGELGRQEANIATPVNLIDISTLVRGVFKGSVEAGREGDVVARQGFSDDMYKDIKESLRPLIDVSAVVALWHKGYYDLDKAEKTLEKHGFEIGDARDILVSSLRLLEPRDIRDLYLRGSISEAVHDSLLLEHGYTDISVARAKELYEVIPPIPDIIRMAVREAWDEGAIRLGGLDRELPSEAADWAKKMGLTSEWFRKYWISHWVIPPVMQGYEMMHRGVITTEELNTLMRALDIAPGWRDKLMAISYAPYTRVDVRRMYREGVIDRAEVKKTYMDLGYDDEHAENLTVFTLKDAMSEIRGLTRTQILDLYTRMIIDEKVALEWIMDLGYPEEIAVVVLSDAMYKREKKIKDRWITLCKKLYLKNIYDDNDVIDKLSSINMLATEVSDLLNQWQLEREAQATTLTWGQLRKLIEKKLIDKDTFKKYMRKLYYCDEDIDLLWKLTGVEVTPEAE